ncbi:MAG: winged helix-turn-helix domain-containing protein [Candidatus Promineifilaceae bacterium]
MNNLENPFYHRGAIRHAQHFFGRSAETAQILGLLRNGQSVSLIGPRRIGKSSLFLHLCRPEVRAPFNLAPPQMLFVLVDCQELGGSPPEEVYEVFLTGLQDAAATAHIPLAPPPNGDSYRALDRTLHQVTQQGIGVVVLLDEFELLASNEQLTPYFFARLRGLTTKYGLAYLTASQHPLFLITADEKILSSPFFNIFVTLPLGLMNETEARELMLSRLEGTGVHFSPEIISHIHYLVGPHPFFLHVAGYHIFQMLADSAVADLETLDTPIEIESESHLSYLWQNLTPEAQYTLAISDGPVDILRMLEQQCLLSPSEQGYRYTSEILRRFIRRQQVEGLIQAGPFVIDPQKHQVKANGQEINLTTSQFDILVCLGKQMNDVVHGEELEMAVWGNNIIKDPDRLKTLIKRLRRAIEPFGNWIVSERGVGYALRPPLNDEP